MEKKYSEQEIARLLKQAGEKVNGVEELSLEELGDVAGGFTSSRSGDTVTINLTESEYTKLKKYLELPLAKSMIAALGFGDIQLARTMRLPADKGEKIAELLRQFSALL